MTDKLGDTLYFDASTHSPTTGAVVDADATPTSEVFENGNDTPVLTPTVTKRTGKTGSYRVPVVATSGNGFSVGPSYLVWLIATVGGIPDRVCIGRFTLEGKRVADLQDIAATDVWSDATKPAGGDIGTIKTETQSHPTLLEIEATTVLAKEETVASRASQTSVDAKASQASVDGKPVLADIEASAKLAKQEEVVRSLGLSQENFAIDQFVYAGGKATSMRLRIYSVAGSVGTDFDVIAVYNITAAYAGDNLTSYQVVKV